MQAASFGRVAAAAAANLVVSDAVGRAVVLGVEVDVQRAAHAFVKPDFGRRLLAQQAGRAQIFPHLGLQHLDDCAVVGKPGARPRDRRQRPRVAG